jgi:hypothetical protein
MYGSWMGVTLGALGVVLLLIAAALTAWTPLFALLIFAVVGMVLLVIAAMRRTAEATPGTGDHAGDPVSYAAPADGEGTASTTSGDGEQQPAAPRLENEPAGIWGEKR